MTQVDSLPSLAIPTTKVVVCGAIISPFFQVHKLRLCPIKQNNGGSLFCLRPGGR